MLLWSGARTQQRLTGQSSGDLLTKLTGRRSCTENNKNTCFFLRFHFHYHSRNKRCLLGCFHRHRSARLLAGTRYRITLLFHHVSQVTFLAVTAFFHALGHGVYVLDDCKVVFVDSTWKVLVICDIAVFAFEVLWLWWDGWSFTGFWIVRENVSCRNLFPGSTSEVLERSILNRCIHGWVNSDISDSNPPPTTSWSCNKAFSCSAYCFIECLLCEWRPK